MVFKVYINTKGHGSIQLWGICCRDCQGMVVCQLLFTAVPKKKNHSGHYLLSYSSSSFVKGVLDSAGFPAVVTAHFVPMEGQQRPRTTILIKFAEEVSSIVYYSFRRCFSLYQSGYCIFDSTFIIKYLVISSVLPKKQDRKTVTLYNRKKLIGQNI